MQRGCSGSLKQVRAPQIKATDGVDADHRTVGASRPRAVLVQLTCLGLTVLSLPPRNHVVRKLLGDPCRRISGVSAARVDIDDDVVPVCQRSPAAPAWSGCILLTRNHTEYAARVRNLPHGPLR